MKAPSHFHQLRLACLPLIQSYFGDLLKHDRRIIRNHPELPFIHFTRDYGTYITMLPRACSDAYPPEGKQVPYLFGNADRLHILNAKRSEIQYATKNHPTAAAHYFDGKKLKKISHSYALDIINDYMSDVMNEWNKKQAA